MLAGTTGRTGWGCWCGRTSPASPTWLPSKPRTSGTSCGSAAAVIYTYLHISTHIYTYLQQYLHRYSSWMEQLGGHPSIVLWVVFNEAWGQHDTETVAR